MARVIKAEWSSPTKLIPKNTKAMAVARTIVVRNMTAVVVIVQTLFMV